MDSFFAMIRVSIISIAKGLLIVNSRARCLGPGLRRPLLAALPSPARAGPTHLMKAPILRPTALAGLIALLPSLASPLPAAVHGWLEWRGPDQTGTSKETHLPDKIDVKNALWVADFPGQ